MLKRVWEQFSQNRLILFLLTLGTISWSLVMVRSGVIYEFGMGFWGPNGHDGVWHLALAKSLAKGSWDMPVFAGFNLQNYHFGFDLLLALINQITKIPIHVLYFQVIPVLLAFLIGIVVYQFVFFWQKSKTLALWAVFFVYFGGSLAWIFGKGESMFWAQQAISTLVNPPFALSVLVLFVGMIILLKHQQSGNRSLLLWCSLVFGILIQIKIYAGLLVIGGLVVTGVYEFLKKRKIIFLELAGLTILISSAIFFSLNKVSANMLVFKPFWFLETMMQLSDRVGWVKFGEAMVNYKLGGVWFKAIPAYIVAFLIFWYGNMGTRFVAEFFVARKLVNLKKLEVFEVFLFSIILTGMLIPMFFLQKGTPWNTIQFFYYSLFLSGILAGIAFAKIIQERNLKCRIVLVVGLIAFTIPTTLVTLKNDYLPTRPPAMLSKAELEALEFLSKEPWGVVLTFPFDELAAKEAQTNPPRPLYLYESTAYVAAFADKPVFLEDEVNLNIMGYDWKTRREDVLEFYQSLDQEHVGNFLKDNKIRYLYWVGDQRAKLGEKQLGIERIFENDEIDIYKVN
jgi:hypothetical protein